MIEIMFGLYFDDLMVSIIIVIREMLRLKRISQYILICLSMLAISCKTKQLLEPPPVIVYEDIEYIDDGGSYIENKSYVLLKITDEQHAVLSAVAVVLVIDKESCLNTYSDFDGMLILKFDKTKINPNSYFEIVYKGFSKKRIPFTTLEKEKLEVIQLEKGDSIVTKEAYERFYHQIRNCR